MDSGWCKCVARVRVRKLARQQRTRWPTVADVRGTRELELELADGPSSLVPPAIQARCSSSGLCSSGSCTSSSAPMPVASGANQLHARLNAVSRCLLVASVDRWLQLETNRIFILTARILRASVWIIIEIRLWYYCIVTWVIVFILGTRYIQHKSFEYSLLVLVRYLSVFN